MQFLFTQLLNVISSFSKPISLLLDDMQWADIASLLLVGNLLSVVIGGSKSVFFAFCYRDDEVSNNEPFNTWLSSVALCSMESIKLENMTAEDVNRLVSESLHLSPRITRPLSSVLHRKTGGNPFFLRQLMYSLNDQNHIRVQLNPPRWVWDTNKIMDMRISDDVVAFLLKDMQRLPTELRLGLEVASCFGSCVKYSVLDILSKSEQVDLQDVLRQASKRGFVDDVGGTMFRFAHDKIKQAAYELMSEEKRHANHMMFGLALAVSNSPQNDEFAFLAVNQVNRGGPDAVLDPSQKFIVARMNLRAGRRAINLSDYNAAFQLFRHGISFLGVNHWVDQYDVSLELFEAAAEAACVLNRLPDVNLYSKQLYDHAKCFNDRLNCK
jgi:predicted ATPase